MANLSCETGPGPHFRPVVKCTPFKGQTVEPRLVVEHAAHLEQQIKDDSKK
jgi:hypothetical protein